jgi:hypothetical protein
MQYKAQIPDAIPINYLDWGSCFTVPLTFQFVTPAIYLTFPNGNDIGPIYEFFAFQNQTGNGFTFCVGILDGGHNTIIGQNFMQGFSFTFNRAKQFLGWTQTDCK